MKNLANKLKNLRKEENYSLEDVQLLLKNKGRCYCKSSLYKWEQGTVQPDLKTLYALSELYHVPLSYLIEDVFTDMNLDETESMILKLIRKDLAFKNMCKFLCIMRIEKFKQKVDKNIYKKIIKKNKKI